MFEQLFSGLKSGLSGIGNGFMSLFNGAPMAQAGGLPNQSVITQPQATKPQNNKFLSLLTDLANQESQASRAQDLYNVLPADQAAQVVNQQRTVGMAEDEQRRKQLQAQTIRDIMQDPQAGTEIERLQKIAAITGDPSMVEKFLVNSGKGGTTPALIQIADQILSTYPPEQRTPELYRQTIETAGKFYDKGIFNQGGGYGGYQPPLGGTPGIATPIVPQIAPLPQGIQFPTDGSVPAVQQGLLPPPLLDGIERPASTIPPVTAPTSGGNFGLSGSYADAIAALEARKAGAKRQAEADVDLATKPEITRAVEGAQGDAKAAAEQRAIAAKKAKDAKIVISLADEADKILKDATSGKIGQAITASNKFLGRSTEATRADARLNVIAAALTSNVPRFEGPQGVMDVKIYQQAAADVGNTDLPYQDRQAALQTVRDLQKRYLPENQDGSNPSGGKTGNSLVDKYLE